MNLKEYLVTWKVRLGYASSFVTMFGVAIMSTQTIQDKLNLINIKISYFLLLSIILFDLFLFAWLLEYFGIYEAEINYSTSKSTLLHKLLEKRK